MEILAIIPARSGSKGLPNKNIMLLNSKPMMAYSIEHALKSKLITRIIVSTDSEQYMEIAQRYGAETPFIRPMEFARDESLDIDVFYHALTWLRDNEGYLPDICIHLRPCSPVRNPYIIDEVVNRLIEDSELDSVKTVSKNALLPYKMWFMSEKWRLSPVITDIHEGYNMPRQSLPETYYPNNIVDAVRSNVILEKKSMTGSNIGGYLIDEFFDIDYPEDVNTVESCIKIRDNRQSFLVDIEGVLLDHSGGLLRKNLEVLKKVKAKGHTVYLRCQEEKREKLIEKLSEKTFDGLVSSFVETDFYISPKNIDIALLDMIIE